MTQVYRLCASAYRDVSSDSTFNTLHSQLLIHISTPSTTNNEGGGWLATGPIGAASGFSFPDYTETNTRQIRAVNRGLILDEYVFYQTGDRLFRCDYTSAWDTDPGVHDGLVGNYYSILHTFTNMEAGRTGRNTGIYACLLPSGSTYQRYVVGVYNSTVAGANTWKGFRHDVNTGVTSETSATDLSFAATPSQGGVKAEIFWNNKLYFIGATDGGVGVFDPSSMTIDKHVWTTTDIWGPHDFCPYQSKLYCVNRGENGGGGGSGIYIWEIGTGGGNKNRLAHTISYNGFGVPSYASEQFEGRSVLFTDREYLYAGITSYVSEGTIAYAFHRLLGDGAGNFSYTGRAADLHQADSSVRVNFFAEQNTNPDILGNGYDAPNGQLLTTIVDTSGIAGAIRWQGAWNGPDTGSTQEESVGLPSSPYVLHTKRETARSHCKNGGGERIFTPGAEGGGGPRADITSVAMGSTSGVVAVTYNIFNNPADFPAGTPAWIQLRYNTSMELPFNRGKLRSPSVGSLVENSTAIKIPSSASGVDYTFEWDYRHHGINASSAQPLVNLFISTTGTA